MQLFHCLDQITSHQLRSCMKFVVQTEAKKCLLRKRKPKCAGIPPRTDLLPFNLRSPSITRVVRVGIALRCSRPDIVAVVQPEQGEGGGWAG
jgi:hypothetical protein